MAAMAAPWCGVVHGRAPAFITFQTPFSDITHGVRTQKTAQAREHVLGFTSFKRKPHTGENAVIS